MLNLYDDIMVSVLEMFDRYDPIELDNELPLDLPCRQKQHDTEV